MPLLNEAQQLEKELLDLVFKERKEDELLDWASVNDMLDQRDQLHRSLAEKDDLDADTRAFLQTAYHNTQTLLKLAGDVQELTKQELIKIEKGRKAHHAYY